MARPANNTDFSVPVPGVGTFTVGRRTFRDEVSIQAEFARLIEGTTPTEWLTVVCNWLALFKVLIVRAPAEWDIDAMDPLDEETYAKMGRVYAAITEQERSFRRGHGSPGETGGTGPAGDNRV